MTAIASQVHGKFKVFTGKLSADNTLGALATEVENWVAGAGVAPKSIGVEYLESAARLVLTVGYRSDEPAYRIKLTSASVGKIDGLDPASLAKLEGTMADAASKLENILCHELYITDDREILMVFMTHAS